MFIAIPLETKPSWRSPPWMTALIILVNCAIFWGWQQPEEAAVERAAAQYAATPLPPIELPLFVAHLQHEATQKDDARARLLATHAAQLHKQRAHAALYTLMWNERRFRQTLLADAVITPQDAAYPTWRAERDAFTPQEPRPFTARWAMNYEAGAGWQPVQALTSTFLHGGTGHLLGNMVFLFLFGFTLELALGAFTYLAFYLLCGTAASLFALQFYAGMGSYGLGASGAVSALMAMYAVLYRMRRIRFFYMVLFYFNYARWPALVMLPLWMGFELMQHFVGERNVAYMAHLGGLLAGALCMGLYMLAQRVEAPVAEEDRRQAQQKPLREAIARAQRHTDALDFARAAPAWRAAAQLAPQDTQVLRAWFESARHEPASDDFHAAARRIFKLGARDEAERRLQHTAWGTYRQRAKPGPRASAETQHALARTFMRLGEWPDAEALCQSLARAPEHPQWIDTLTQLVNGLAQSGHMAQARAWLPTLQRDAPQEAVTRWLAAQS
ncbi:MAG: rhomboid family intramembrane serine protease [Comamonadaceae bacterium]|nr:MAG: rhomboid family intramembrane serine protease [Comamonadaceae bacterium]